MNNSVPQIFSFPKTTHYPLRSITQNDEPWFVAADVCHILGLGNVSMAINGNEKTGDLGLDEDEKDDIRIPDTLGRLQSTLCVNEPGLYRLIFKSRKEEAKAFTRWVTHEVLPSIRKTGSYSLPTNTIGKSDSVPTQDDIDTLILRYVERLYNPSARDLSRYLTRHHVSEIRFHLHDLTEQGKLEEIETSHTHRYTIR